jgi:hypothetical protein
MFSIGSFPNIEGVSGGWLMLGKVWYLKLYKALVKYCQDTLVRDGHGIMETKEISCRNDNI